jgi:TM2 domain-containing membrane protein YozV
MINEQTATENKQLQTNLAQEILEQFMNLKSRISIGISYLDLQRALGDLQVTIDKFERSSDRDVCLYLTELVRKVMLYYGLMLQFANSRYLPNEIIKTYFPDTPKSIIHGSYSYDIKILKNSWLEEAGKLVDELHEILNKPVDLNTLNDVEKITALPQKTKQPNYNASRDKFAIAIIAIFLGVFGIHKFLLGYIKEGLIVLSISLILLAVGHSLTLTSFISIIEGIIYMSKSNQDFARIYVSGKRRWF